jgi:hypothetical protein
MLYFWFSQVYSVCTVMYEVGVKAIVSFRITSRRISGHPFQKQLLLQVSSDRHQVRCATDFGKGLCSAASIHFYWNVADLLLERGGRVQI